MKNKYNIQHTPSDGTIVISHNINSDVLIEENHSLGIRRIRDAEDVKKRAERLFKHFSLELKQADVTNQLSISKTERQISFQAKDVNNVIKALQRGIEVSFESDVDTDELEKLAKLGQLVDPSRGGSPLNEEESKILDRFTITAESAHPDDWRDLESDVMPFLTSIASTSTKSRSVPSKKPGLFSRLFCCCSPSQSRKEDNKESLLSSSSYNPS